MYEFLDMSLAVKIFPALKSKTEQQLLPGKGSISVLATQHFCCYEYIHGRSVALFWQLHREHGVHGYPLSSRRAHTPYDNQGMRFNPSEHTRAFIV